jgi:hypothetical protein
MDHKINDKDPQLLIFDIYINTYRFKENIIFELMLFLEALRNKLKRMNINWIYYIFQRIKRT